MRLFNIFKSKKRNIAKHENMNSEKDFKSSTNPSNKNSAYNNNYISKNRHIPNESYSIEVGNPKELHEYIYKKFIDRTYIEFPNIFSKEVIYSLIDGNIGTEDLYDKFPSVNKKDLKSLVLFIRSLKSTARDKFRAEDINLNWYRWRTSEDQRVRNSHKNLSGVLIRWDELISPELLVGDESIGTYHAGEDIGCRCYPETLVSLDFIKWPCKVYYQGEINTMTKEEFEKIYKNYNKKYVKKV